MSIDRSITGRSSKIFVLAISNMRPCSHISVFFSQSKINKKQLKIKINKYITSILEKKKKNYFIAMTSDSHKKVIRFNITMNKAFTVYIFNTADHLVGKHKHCLQSKSPRTKIEKIF